MSCVICSQEISTPHDYVFNGTRIYLPNCEQYLESEIKYDCTNLCLTCADIANKSLSKDSNIQS